MATINKKLVHFNSELSFEAAKNNGQLKDSSIVFVGDHNNAKGKKIYTHGETYYTNYSGTNGIEVQDSQIGIVSDNILFFASENSFDNFVAELGGEENLPVPCVIFIEDLGAVYYNT